MSAEGIFGTDGIRGRAGEGWLTPEAAARVGYAAGRVLAGDGTKGALLGHDGRRSGPGSRAHWPAGWQQRALPPRAPA